MLQINVTVLCAVLPPDVICPFCGALTVGQDVSVASMRKRSLEESSSLSEPLLSNLAWIAKECSSLPDVLTCVLLIQ